MKDFSNLYEFGTAVEKGKSFVAPRCYESHPALKIGEYEVYGGNCGSPIVKDADIYVGLDYSTRTTYGSYPWNNTRVEIYFPIKDMHAPDDPKEFHRMIEWLADQIRAGKKVHIGCIGGHGRTGTVLSALVAHMTGNEDATEYVRKNYCTKAVESDEQIRFLKKHYNIKEVNPTKLPYTGNWEGVGKGKKGKSAKGYGTQADLYKNAPGGEVVYPVESPKSVWGKVGK